MKNFILTIVSTLFLIIGCKNQSQSQTKSIFDRLNLDFENIENGIPIGWQANKNDSGYRFSIDSTIVKNGKYAVAVEYKSESVVSENKNPKFGMFGLFIHEKFDGKRITLSGYIKTENVTDGYASLLLRIDPEIGVNSVKITGTTEWKKYEISINMNPEKTNNFAIGAMLVGKGKVWFDDLRISVDGTDINNLVPIEIKILPALSDNEFDNGSSITLDVLSDTQTENLNTLGLVWGFLKYYHPSIAKGNFNWDYELFRILPKILNAKNSVQQDEILIKWINSLGEFSISKDETIEIPEIKIEPDLDWIYNLGFSNELSSLLIDIKNAIRIDENHYVELQSVGNPKFINEKPYSEMAYPDVGFRLLALYRYWNIIQYYFPYKYLIEEDWVNVLKEFIPKIVNTKNETEYTLTVLELIGRIHDTHANIWGVNKTLLNYFGKYYAPLELTFVENQPVVTGFYENNLGIGKEMDIEIGDILTKINSIAIVDIIKANLKYTPASNYSTQLRDIAGNLLRTNDSIINLEFIRNNIIFDKAVNVYENKEPNIHTKYLATDTCFKIINEEIAYINNGSLKREYLPKIWENIKQTKGLIIDNRNYPSDFPIYDLSNYLMPANLPFFKGTIGSISTPGRFSFQASYSVGVVNSNFYNGKVIILVNELTQSSAEFHTMAYMVHPNATVIGSTTAGSDGNVSQFYLPGGLYTMISGVGIYYPDGKETQRVGIIPNIEVKPTIKGIQEGRDELLEKAIEIIRKEAQ